VLAAARGFNSQANALALTRSDASWDIDLKLIVFLEKLYNLLIINKFIEQFVR
jgi:hypothetical protein